MKTVLWKRFISLSLGVLLLFSLSLTALGVDAGAPERDWTQDQDLTIADPAPWNLEELKQVVDVHDPRSVAAYWVWSLNRLVENYDDGMEMMKYLFADLEPYGDGFQEGGYSGQAGWDGYFNERLSDSDYSWLPRAFYEGASASNGFALVRPLTLRLHFNEPNTKTISEQGKDFGRACIVYWVQSHAGGTQVNLNLMKFTGSDRWYVTNGTASSGIFYDQRSALTPEELKLAKAGIPGDGSTAEEHAAFYGSAAAEPQPSSGPQEPEVPDEPETARFVAVNTYTEGQFKDVPSNYWGAPNVAKAFELGLMKGVGEGFDPKGNVTLAQAITMAARIHSIYNTGSEDFVQGSPWYQVYVDYADENGILAAHYPDYNVPATRLEFAAILANALPREALPEISDIRDDAIPDVRSYDSHAEAVYLLYRAGILTGSEDGSFNPDSSITRAEAAAIITRMADPSLRKAITLN